MRQTLRRGLLLPGLLTLLAFIPFTLFAQQSVTGTVRSGNAPVQGATVTVKGTKTISQTDKDGKFTISVPPDGTLVFTHVSFTMKEVPVAGQTALSIDLDPVNTNLGDVIVVGYSTQKRATLTGSVSVVKGEDIVKSPQPNLSNSLSGRFTGLIATNRSGEPGYDGSGIYIRGLATTGNNDVLIVVDGVPGQIGGLERLDPNDVESMTILKDASAAVYGSRAANGVILVTTKRGKTGKPVINYRFNQGFSSPTRLPKMADAPMYATLMNEIAYYDNQAGGLNQYYTDDQITKFRDGSDPLNYPNTNWPKTVLKKSALQNQHSLSVNGGSENVKYYVSLGLLGQDGLYKNGVTHYDQYNFRSNIDANVTDRFKVSLYLSGREEDRQYPQMSSGDLFRSLYRAYPTVAARYPNGLLSTGIENTNALAQATDIGGTNRNPTQVFNGILKGSYAIPGIKGLTLDGFMALDKSWSFDKSFSQPYNLYTYNKTTGSYDATIVGGSAGLASLYETQLNKQMTTYNIKLGYIHSFGGHNINAFVAYEESKNSTDSLAAWRLNFPTATTPELSQGGSAATDKGNAGSSYNFSRKSVISRLAYDYQEKYLFEAQLRVDGSSTFPAAHRYGYFPSVSAGWRISKEDFFRPVTFINDLKIRGSYGTLGNDNVGLFQYFNNYTFNNQYVIGGDIHPGIDLIKLQNPDITWEVAKKLDIGMNAQFLNHFNMEFIYFQQHRIKILAYRNASVPQVSGIVNPYGSDAVVPAENIGQVNSNGIEATLGYNNQTKSGFRYGISGNFTYAKSKIIFIDEAPGTLAYQRQTGRPMNTYLLYKAKGIYKSSDDLNKYPHLTGNQLGDLIYDDYNGDGNITADDQVRTKYGNIPEITYGILLNAGYKDFDISVVMAGQAHVSQYVLPESGTVGNFYSSWADNRWSPTHTNGYYPRADDRASASINGGLYQNTFWLNNANFFRLKNIELGYTLPASVLSKIRVSSIRVYANAFNLFTITKVKDYDPEGYSTSGQFYPQQRIVNVGLNVKF